MKSMFEDCSSLEEVDVSSLNTASVKDMSRMFAGCASLKALDMSSFSTEATLTADEMLEGCASLVLLDMSTFNPDLVRDNRASINNVTKIQKLSLPAGVENKDFETPPTSRSKSLEHDATKTEIPEMTTENVSQNAAQGTIENEYVAELQIAGNAPLGVFSDAQAESEVNQSQNMTGEQPGTPLLLNILDALTMSGAEVLTESIERIGNAEDARSFPQLTLPIKLLATTILLIIVIPTTILSLRDRRK